MITNKKYTSPNYPKAVKLLAVTFLFMISGSLIELYLIDHFEDTEQLIPIISIAFSLLSMVLIVFRNTPLAMFIFRVSLILLVISGMVGIFLHLQINYEFEKEMRPDAETGYLLKESMSGALPALAPGSLFVLALIGYIYSVLKK